MNHLSFTKSIVAADFVIQSLEVSEHNVLDTRVSHYHRWQRDFSVLYVDFICLLMVHLDSVAFLLCFFFLLLYFHGFPLLTSTALWSASAVLNNKKKHNNNNNSYYLKKCLSIC